MLRPLRHIQIARNFLSLIANSSAHPPPASGAAPKPDPIAAIDHYALHQRKRTALIRRLGRLPDKLAIGCPPPAVVRAIASGTDRPA